MKFKKSYGALLIFCIFLCFLSSGFVYAEKWPEKEITIIVPFGAGGGFDSATRIIAAYFSEELGVPVIIDNRTGGGSLIGTEAFAQLPTEWRDGRYLCSSGCPHVTGAIINGGSFSIDDFAYINTTTHNSPYGIWVEKESPFGDLVDLFEYIKEEPCEFGFIPGSYSEVVVKYLNEIAEGKGVAIPYPEGGGALRLAQMSGDLTYMGLNFYQTQKIAGEDLRCLVLFSDERLDDYPEIPTMKEKLHEFGVMVDPPSAMASYGILFTHKEFKEKYPDRWEIIVEALKAAYNNPEMIETFKEHGEPIKWIGPEETEKLVDEQNKLALRFKDLFSQ